MVEALVVLLVDVVKVLRVVDVEEVDDIVDAMVEDVAADAETVEEEGDDVVVVVADVSAIEDVVVSDEDAASVIEVAAAAVEYASAEVVAAALFLKSYFNSCSKSVFALQPAASESDTALASSTVHPPSTRHCWIQSAEFRHPREYIHLATDCISPHVMYFSISYGSLYMQGDCASVAEMADTIRINRRDVCILGGCYSWPQRRGK